MELFGEPLSRGVYHLPNPDPDGNVYVYAVDSSGTIAVGPEPVPVQDYYNATERAWRHLDEVDPSEAVA